MKIVDFRYMCMLTQKHPQNILFLCGHDSKLIKIAAMHFTLYIFSFKNDMCESHTYDANTLSQSKNKKDFFAGNVLYEPKHMFLLYKHLVW